MPTRWVKFVFAIFLLPICAILSQTFFTAFARATVDATALGRRRILVLFARRSLWLIAFFGLPRPMLIYVFGHELTHALWVWLMGGRVSRFRVGRDGGHVVTSEAIFGSRSRPIFSRSTAFWRSPFMGRSAYFSTCNRMGGCFTP